ncbi:hypothetical protein HHK36_003639 [Tetracentron sinense]|uniref:Uncharacterized protein n=1 Tax=Tetracentron sinense TaxID=13715 RepID=A0A834ZT91_TETSI|nr:hypothetical protein HHK36_003639 [Tetracentron sinense]
MKTCKILYSAFSQEKIRKIKLQFPVDFSGQMEGSLCNKRLGMERLDSVIHKKKSSSMKSLSTQNKFKTIRTSKFRAKHQQWDPPVLPVHSIPRNQAKVISGMNSSAKSDIQVGNQANSRRIHQSDRHVTFSGKNDILGPRKKWFSSIELPQVQSLSKVVSDVISPPSVKDHMMGSDKDLSAIEVNGSDEDVSICTVDGTGHRPTIENIRFADVHGHVALPTFLSPNNSCQEKDKNSSEISVDINQTLQHSGNFRLFNRGNSAASHNLSYAGVPRLLQSTSKEGFNPSMITQADGNVQRAPSTSRNLAVPCGDHIPESSAMSSAVNVMAPSQPSSSCLAMNKETNGRHPFLSQVATQNSHGCASQYQPSCHMSPKDMMSNMCSSAEWKKQGAVLCRGERIDEDFIGLPLNSQGELIQLHSGSKVGFNQLKRQSTIMGSSSNFPTHNLVLPKSKRDHLKMKENHYVERALPIDHVRELFPVQNYLTGNSELPISSRLDVTELQCTGRTEVNWQDSLRGNNHSVHLLGSDLNSPNISCHGCRQTQNQTENGKNQSKENLDHMFLHTNQPTMRLMGKDVTVGRSNQQIKGFEDGIGWTDKEIITEHHPTMTGSNNPLERYFQPDLIVHPISGKSKETLTHSLEAQINPASQRFLQMKAAEPRFSHAYLDWQSQVMLQNGPPWISGNPSAQLPPFAHPIPSALLNRTSRFPEPCISDIESLKISSQIAVPESTTHNACQNMLLNPAELNYKQSLPRGATSAFKFPFSQQDCREYVLPSWSQSSSGSMPQWLINAKQQKETSITYSDAGVRHHPYTMSGNNFLNIPSPHPTSLVSYPYNSNTSHYCMQSSPVPVSSFHPPLIPAFPGFKPTSGINMSSNRIKVKDRMKSKSFRLKDHGHAKKSKKRPAAKASDSKKPLKKPNLEMQGDSSAMTGLNKRVNFNGYTQRNAGAPEFDQLRDTGKDVGYYPMEIQKDGLRTSSGIDSFKMDGFARLGPIKLSAGAKHILKPSQNLYQDKSRPTHSTIPFAAVPNSSKVPEFQNKSEKIYRF